MEKKLQHFVMKTWLRWNIKCPKMLILECVARLPTGTLGLDAKGPRILSSASSSHPFSGLVSCSGLLGVLCPKVCGPRPCWDLYAPRPTLKSFLIILMNSVKIRGWPQRTRSVSELPSYRAAQSVFFKRPHLFDFPPFMDLFFISVIIRKPTSFFLQSQQMFSVQNSLYMLYRFSS